jgi:hypothetical protein
MDRISRRGMLGVLGAGVCAALPQDNSATSARERLALNGDWRWQSADTGENTVPAQGWSTMRVPDAWPRTVRGPAAWYQREIAIPASWSGRRIVLAADVLNSYAAVYVDGERAGEMRYPAGEVDLSRWCRPGQTHVLSLQVTAMPLKALMLSYSDTAAAKTVEGTVARRGLCGDVWLSSVPTGPRIGAVKVETSVRKWQIAVEAPVEGAEESGGLRVIARVFDRSRIVKELAGEPGRVTASWHPEKLWDTHTPQNQYRLTMSLVDGAGKTIDETVPVRFGFREFWIEGRDFYLNGTRIYLSTTPLDSAQESIASAGYEATRAVLQHFKSFGVNFVYTHNYGCEPGTHFSFEAVLRAADDEGMLLAFSQPHFGQYDWATADSETSNGYAQHAAFYVRVAQNHPSVVCYSTSHNGAGYSEDMNPDLLDGVHEPRDQWSARGAQRALRAEAIIKRLDASRIVYHHSGGNLGSMHTINFYGNFIPPQEMSDWFEHWSKEGVKPLYTCEFSVPFLWDWGMYRGWFKGKREFGSAAVPWEFCLAEWDAQFLGDRAYRITDEERVNLRWEAEQFGRRAGWYRWDYPHVLGSAIFQNRLGIMAAQVEENWRAFRTWGLSANGVPWDIGNYWKKTGDGYQPTVVAEALMRCNMPLLAYIAGKPDAFTSKDHNFVEGETIEKQLIVINNSRERIKASWSWNLGDRHAQSDVTVAPGAQQRIPLRLAAPAAGRHELTARVHFPDGKMQQDSLVIDVMPRAAPTAPKGKIAVFDPSGALKDMGTPVDAASDLAGFDTLIVGKGALTLKGAAPDLSRVRDGLKVIVFEQCAEVMEQRLGLRVAEYGLRWVFARVDGHPLLNGLPGELLRNWRGSATLTPPRRAYQPGPQFNNAPTVQWAGIPVTRVWRCGNRGNVASVLIEKPACGDFLAVLDGGYGLQYSPLLEYREGKGMVLFCQVDVTGRTESDPAAQTLMRNILQYVAGWNPAPRRSVRYAGPAAGAKYLESAGFALSNEGDATIAFGLDQGAAAAILPGVTMAAGEHIAAHFEPFGMDSPFTGISPAEVHNRDSRKVPLVTGGATIVGGGVLAASADGRVVFSQLAPWQFDCAAGGKMNQKRTFRNFARLTARLLGNLGAESRTPLLERFSRPAADGDKRWLTGLYLDQPEEWDDPYRFFRW